MRVNRLCRFPAILITLAISTTHTPFDKLRTGFDTASTTPFDYALRQAQDMAQDAVSDYSGC